MPASGTAPALAGARIDAVGDGGVLTTGAEGATATVSKGGTAPPPGDDGVDVDGAAFGTVQAVSTRAIAATARTKTILLLVRAVGGCAFSPGDDRLVPNCSRSVPSVH
jgi:hypothetical protein